VGGVQRAQLAGGRTVVLTGDVAVSIRVAVAMFAGMTMAVLVASPGMDRADGRTIEPERHRGQQHAGNSGRKEERQAIASVRREAPAD
jgi:hypothetical protein